jgi:hypothetical protein
MACHGSALFWLKELMARPYIRRAPFGKNVMLNLFQHLSIVKPSLCCVMDPETSSR